MKLIDIFRIAVRFVGLVGLLYTCRHIFVMIHRTGSWHMGWLVHSWDKTGKSDLGDARALVLEILLILVGVYMVRGAPLLLKFMFPEEHKNSPDQSFKPRV